MMRNTIFCLTEAEPDRTRITESVLAMIREIQQYVPGYTLVNGPVYDGNKVSIYLKVEGLGDYLPKYAGNLDIMTAAATRTAELFAMDMASAKPSPGHMTAEVML
jgi:acetaldehyde/propanal dehydrogenase